MLEVAMVMDNSDHQGAGAYGASKSLSYRVEDSWVLRQPQSAFQLEKMTGLFSPLCTLLQSLSDGK
jgi:hypothetical protein